MAATSTLTDNFDDNSINGTLWTATDANVVETNQQIEMTIPAMTSAYYNLNANTNYDLTGSYVYSKLVYTDEHGSFEAYPVHLTKDANNTISIMVYNGDIYARKKVSGISSTVGSSVAYDSGVHIYFKIREASGTTYWDYSTDGSSYSNIASAANPITVTSLQPQIITGAWGIDGSARIAKYDNFNTLGVTTALKDIIQSGIISFPR